MHDRNSRWLEALFVKAKQGFIIFDKDGEAVMANPAAWRILGRTLNNLAELVEDERDPDAPAIETDLSRPQAR